MSVIQPIILCGGAGTRLWPLSRSLFPKQLLPLHSEQTLLQETLLRCASVAGKSPLLVCSEDHRFIAAGQAQEVGISGTKVMLEPARRDTAPALTAAAAYAAKTSGPETVLLVLPADHVIENQIAFDSAVRAACAAAEHGNLVTLGVVPSRSETGYGYIKRGQAANLPRANDTSNSGRVFSVEQFVEKPKQSVAEQYLASGEYLWNSGMFVFRADAWLSEARAHIPEVVAACEQAVDGAQQDMDFVRLDAKAFAASPGISIDYAVMEKTNKALVVPLDAGWNDIGSWSALADARKQDEAGNALIGDVLIDDCKNSLIYADSRLVAGVGLEDMVVVETADAVLVVPKSRSQDIKGVVSRLRESARNESDLHRKVYRPWGAYEAIDESDRFQVKRITVTPGQQLSLQMHHHRAEHWIVVKGTAKVTKDDETFLLTEDQSTYIPLGVTHRLENPGSIDLELIEVQSGAYLGEDDIVRFEDTYGRTA